MTMRNHIVKKALVLCEVFHPEDFLINDLVQEWEKKGYELEVLTRVPSYPFGKVYNGYKNNNIPLEEALSIFEQGIKLAKGMEKELSKIESKIQILMNQPSSESEPKVKPELDLFSGLED